MPSLAQQAALARKAARHSKKYLKYLMRADKMVLFDSEYNQVWACLKHAAVHHENALLVLAQ